jgi:hypothetical protein
MGGGIALLLRDGGVSFAIDMTKGELGSRGMPATQGPGLLVLPATQSGASRISYR